MPEQHPPQSPRPTRAHRAGLPLLRIVREPAASRAPRARRPGQVDVDLRAGDALSSLDARLTRPGRRPLTPSAPPATGIRIGLDTDPRAHARVGRPRLSRRTRVAIIAILLIQGVFGALILWAVTSPTWQVRWVRVDGTSDATLIAAIHKLPLTGCNVFHCDTAHALALVSALPLVAHAETRVSYPDGLIVTVTTRSPTLLWSMDTQTEIIASDGMALGPVGNDPALTQTALPQVTDAGGAAFAGQTPQAGARIDAGLVRMAGQLRMSLDSALGSSWVLEYSGDNGLFATNARGQVVIFGMPADAAAALNPRPGSLGAAGSPSGNDITKGTQIQMREAQQLLVALAKRGETPALIDVRWGAHPYYRLSA